MANTTIYYPLIKKGFQEVADVSSIESDIAQLQSDVSTLQSNKVTKCFNATDLANLAVGEIFTWHGATTSSPAELTQGYFYKKNAGTPYNIVAGTQYFNYSGAQTLNINGYNFKPGDYYILEDNTPAEGSNFYDIYLTNFTSNDDYYFIGNVFDLQPGSYLWQLSTLSFIKVTSFSYPSVTLENGDTFSVSSYSRARAQNLYSCISSDGNLVSIITTGFGLLIVHYTLNGNDFSLIDWFYPYPTSRGETIEDITINTYIFEQTDTQPKLENVANGAGGVLNINTDTNIAGNLTVSGTTSTVHAQEIQSEADYIELRNGNPLALANNERSGLEINNYDGNGTDCVLAVDNQGWARVGDKSGTLQKLATIEETPTNGALLKYNSTTQELESDTRIFVELTKSFTVTNYYLPARITASGNYISFTLFYPIPATATNINLQISKCILLYEQTQSFEATVASYILIPNLGLTIEILLNNSRTAFTICGVLIDFTLSFD